MLAEESGVHTIQGGGEPLDHAGQPGDDRGKLLDHPAAAQLRGVVRDRLEPQHALAPLVYALPVNRPKRSLNTVRSNVGVSIAASMTEECMRVRRGRCAVPKTVRILGTSSRERVRSTTVSKSRCILAPSAKIRLRLYSS